MAPSYKFEDNAGINFKVFFRWLIFGSLSQEVLTRELFHCLQPVRFPQRSRRPAFIQDEHVTARIRAPLVSDPNVNATFAHQPFPGRSPLCRFRRSLLAGMAPMPSMMSASTLARLLTFPFAFLRPCSLPLFLCFFARATGGCGLGFGARVVVLCERNAAKTDDRCERKNDH